MCMNALLHALLLLLLFIGILGPPTFLLRRLIVAGCVGLNARGKQNSYYLFKRPEKHFVLSFVKVHVFKIEYFEFLTRIKGQTFNYTMKRAGFFCL